MLLKHHLEQGVLTAELSRRFGVSRATIHEWIKKGRLDRDLAAGGSLHGRRGRQAHSKNEARIGRFH